MAVLNEHLREIAYRIMGEAGFSTDGQGLLRAHARWVELTGPEERLALERALFLRWLEDLRAERQRGNFQLPSPVSRDDRPRVVPGRAEDVQPGLMPQPAADLKFRSESPDWRDEDALADAVDFPGGHERRDSQKASAAGDQVSVSAIGPPASKRATPAREQVSRRASPVTVRHIPAPVQQPSRKVASYQQMFPELALRTQTASGAKPLAEFTADDMDYRIGALREQRRSWRIANGGDEARIEGRERLNAKDRVRIAEREKNIRDAEAEEGRLSAVKREVAGAGCAVIGDLPVEVLAACGFKKRVT